MKRCNLVKPIRHIPFSPGHGYGQGGRRNRRGDGHSQGVITGRAPRYNGRNPKEPQLLKHHACRGRLTN